MPVDTFGFLDELGPMLARSVKEGVRDGLRELGEKNLASLLKGSRNKGKAKRQVQAARELENIEVDGSEKRAVLVSLETKSCL